MLYARDSILKNGLLRTEKNTEHWVVFSMNATAVTYGEEITQIRRKNKGTTENNKR